MTSKKPMTAKLTWEAAVEEMARAHYEKFFENVADLEPKWRDAGADPAQVPDESYWHRMVEAQIAALTALSAHIPIRGILEGRLVVQPVGLLALLTPEQRKIVLAGTGDANINLGPRDFTDWPR